MDSARWQRLQDLFHRAAGLDGAARREFLDQSCAGDETLRREVEALLAAAPGATTFFGQAPADRADQDLRIGERAGPYRLVRRLGEGGMGTVYLAERADGEFTQKVAVKLVRSPWLTPEMIDRFRAEREILAHLEHPNIARLLDGGTTALGQPYLAMEYVEGEPIDAYCIDRRLSTRARLKLFLDVCTAVAHAHRQLVVHRDLKPANILVTADGVPKLLDFGIAKLLSPGADIPALTLVQGPVLTPEYASPEQVRGEPAGTASDIYSLGVLLYQMLSGTPPYRFDTKTPQEIERVVCEQSPVRPSAAVPRTLDPATARLRRELSGDLDTIVLTALRKHPENRYPSVEWMAGDVRHHLESRPISARRASRGYVLRKFIRRHRAGMAAAAITGLALVAGTVIAVWGMLQAQAERDRAQVEALRAEQTSAFVINMLGSIDPDYANGADTELMQRVLEDAATRAPVELAGQPSVLSDIQYVIGRVYALIGMRDQAREHLTLATDLARDTPEAPRYLKPQITLARGDAFTGEYAGALARIESVLELAAHLPPDDPLRLSALQIKGHLLVQLNENAAAEAIAHELIDLTGDTGNGALTDLRIQGLHLLALVEMHFRRFEQSHRQFERVREEAAAWDDPAALRHIARALHDQGVAFQREQRFEEAESLLRECLELQEQRYGADHPALIASTGSLATVLLEQARLDEARPLFERALAMAREAYGPEQPVTLLIQNNLGNLLRRQGNAAAAADLHRAVVASAGSAFPPDHPMHGYLLRDLGRSELAMGNAAAAQSLLKEAIIRFTEAFGEDHNLVKQARDALAEALEAAGNQGGQE